MAARTNRGQIRSRYEERDIAAPAADLTSDRAAESTDDALRPAPTQTIHLMSVWPRTPDNRNERRCRDQKQSSDDKVDAGLV